MKKTLLLALALTTTLTQAPLFAEPIALFGQVLELDIPQRIPECPKTWNQLRAPTLAYLAAQPQTATSPTEAQKLLQNLNKELAKKNNEELVFLATQTKSSVWETASVFQLGQGREIDPELQQNVDINNGLYQIETALEATLQPHPHSLQGTETPPVPQKKPTPPTSLEWSTK
jgi:hypothetical protein